MTCGYLCPNCEGRGIDDEGNNCFWCTPADNKKSTPKEEISDKAWIESVHQGNCCWDDSTHQNNAKE